MDKWWAFRIDGPILAWKRPAQSGKVRFDPPDQVAYKRMVAMLCAVAMRRAGVKMIPKGEPIDLGVRVFFRRPESRIADRPGRVLWHTEKPDLDNVVKNIKDALKGVAWVDDKQVSSYTDSGKFWLPTLSAETEYAVVSIGPAPEPAPFG